LCMKILAPEGVITVFGDQQEAWNIEKGHTPSQTNVYQLKSTEERKEPYVEAKRDKEKNWDSGWQWNQESVPRWYAW
jgi:hypothetical protein